MVLPKRLLLSVLFVVLSLLSLTSVLTAQSTPAAPTVDHQALAGIWELNRDRSELPGPDSGSGDAPRGRRGGFGGGGGGRGGFGGGQRGGVGGRGGGDRDGGGVRDQDAMQGVLAYMRTLNQPSKRLVIAVREPMFVVTDAEGGVQTLRADNKSEDERAENGLVKLKRKTQWDGGVLVSDVEIGRGPKIERRYELSPGGTALRISTKVTGGGRSGTRTSTFVYERPPE